MRAMWIGQTEGARFWLRLMNEHKGRGVAGILIAVVSGLKRFPEAMADASPLLHRLILYRAPDPLLAAARIVKRVQNVGQGLRVIDGAVSAGANERALNKFEGWPLGLEVSKYCGELASLLSGGRTHFYLLQSAPTRP